VNAPEWLKPIVESQGGALLFAGETAGDVLHRAVVIPFDLRRSDLPLQIAFPILIANSVEWLAPPQGLNVPASVKPGEVAPMPEGTRVTLPSGEAMLAGRRGFAQTNQTGIYGFNTGQVQGIFAVNFSNTSESRIAPNPSLQVGGDASANAQASTSPTSQREFWHVLAAIALILLLVEWWIYQRGLPVLRRKA
jgi:hypothetical protein